MRLRIAFAVLVYAAALGLGAFAMTGHLGLAPYREETAQAQDLSDRGSPLLLCSGYGFACNGSSPFYPVNQPISPCAYGCVQAYAPFDTYPFVRQPVPDFVNDKYTFPATYYSPSVLLCPWGCATPTLPQNTTGQIIQDPAYSYTPATVYQPPWGSFNAHLYAPQAIYNFGVVNVEQIYGVADDWSSPQFGNTWSNAGY